MEPRNPSRPATRRPVLTLAALAVVTLLGFGVATVLPEAEPPADELETVAGAPTATVQPRAAAPSQEAAPVAPSSAAAPSAPAASLPGGVSTIFGDDRFLVAYYGTAGTGALGVLGEDPPEQAFARLQQAAAPFARANSQVMPVFELIVTVADGFPGPDGDYSHDISRAQVQTWIDAAHEHGALLLLDVQPGRASFPEVAKRWAWALRDPYVGLALDPEWRMGPGEVPAQRVGSVSAREVNQTSAWLRDLVARQQLPQKLSTYRTVARPRMFRMGFKLFYDEDTNRMSAADVRRIRPKVRFVSFQ